MRNTKVLLIGCGEIGSRHLQAIASLKNINEIHSVDPNSQSLSLGKHRLNEIVNINTEIKFKWFHDLNKESAEGDLCVVATQAKYRCSLIKRIRRELNYKNFLVEKIVSQSVKEYEDLLSYAEQEKLSIWVNCKSRAYGIHKYIKSRLSASAPIVYQYIGGNHGLANNGIHKADLFIFFDQTGKIESKGTRIDEILHPSKRGPDVFDLSGTLCGYSDKGSDFILSFSGHHKSPDHLSIVSPTSRFIVDHFQKFAYESYSETGWRWSKIPMEENWMISHMSKAFISDILNKRTCELPTLVECFPSHKYILTELLPHFNHLLKVQNDYCPVA